MAKLVVQLVTWNGAKYLPFLLASLRSQTFKDWELVIWDNHSTDTTIATLKNELAHFPVSHRLIENDNNYGFTKGHNALFSSGKSDLVLLLNQDIILAEDCFEKLCAALDHNPTLAAVAPRLMRWDFSKAGQPCEKTNQLDSLGLQVLRSRRVIERSAGLSWDAIKIKLASQTLLPAFGVSGALPMYRRSALTKIQFSDGTLFDESYHSYKEDIDVAYRLRSAGFEAATVLSSVAWHDRSVGGPAALTDHAAAKNKFSQSSQVQLLSYINHLATLYKNEYWQNLLLDFPWIIWYELKKFIYYIMFEPAVLKGLGELWKGRLAMKQKKTKITAKRDIGWREMRTWWL